MLLWPKILVSDGTRRPLLEMGCMLQGSARRVGTGVSDGKFMRSHLINLCEKQ